MRSIIRGLALVVAASALPGLRLGSQQTGDNARNQHDNLARATSPVPTISGISATLLFQNDLNSSAAASHLSAILTGRVTVAETSLVCGAINETPMTSAMVRAQAADVLAQFNFLCYVNSLPCPTGIWLNDGVLQVQADSTAISIVAASGYAGQSLPVLCTQSDTSTTVSGSGPSSTNKIIAVGANGNKYQGYRNKKSFRFLGIPFSNSPGRFEYSSVNPATNTLFDATAYGPQCPQSGLTNSNGQSEDCLFLDLFTPYLPASGSSTSLRPVLVFIHGGRFINGDASTYDGGNQASRDNIVSVYINYRLSTYGFMAVSGSTLTGNYGISDMVSALDWIKDNIASFGGDPNQITIAGQSAGAAAVRILLGSKAAMGKYQGAIIMSNLGGGADLGAASDIGTSNSQYYTIQQSYELVGASVLQEAKCNQGSLAAQVSCLKQYSGDLSAFAYTSRFPVQDGTYISTPYLEVETKGAVANVPVMMGNLLNDGASFTSYTTNCNTEASCISQNLGIPLSDAQSIVNSGLFPYTSTGDMHADSFNVSQQVRTADTFSCIDQSTAYTAATTKSMGPVYYYQYIRSYGGYAEASSELDSTGPVTPGYPNGNPNLPYYRLHSGEEAFALGNEVILRDNNDYGHLQLMTAYWGAFVRTGNPNPVPAWLKARGYTAVSNAVAASGTWQPVAGKNGPIMELDYPSALQNSFNSGPQCEFLKYNLTYYMDS